MRYKWDIDELRLSKGILEEVEKDIDDIEISNNLKSLIMLYDSMIKLTTKKKAKFSDFDDYYTDSSIDNLIIQTTLSYNKKNLPFINVLLNSFFIISNWQLDKDLDNKKVKCTNDELVDIAINFFKMMMPRYIEDEFYKLLDSKYININYANQDSQYGGITLFDPVLSKKYIHINRNNRLLDLVYLPHEAFHYIFNDGNVAVMDDYNTYFLTEVEGALANILFGEYFDKVSYQNNNFFRDYYKLSFQGEIEDLVTRNAVLSSLKSNMKIRFNKLNKYLGCLNVKPFNNENELIKYLDIPEEIHIKYALSYLTAIDLYYLYLKDRDLAFYLLKNIKSVKEEDDIFTLLRQNHITFMDDNYENLKKYIKK